MVLLLVVVLLIGSLQFSLSQPRTYCQPSDPCWPSATDIATLYGLLSPEATRTLVWAGQGTPYPCAIPTESPNEQPLYGAGASLAPLYVQSPQERGKICFTSVNTTRICLVGTRNNPLEGWEPAFVAWPLTRTHVQLLVKFAVDHNLCISVAGTGHDFINRHSCPGGLFIRTTLLKQIQWNPTDTDPTDLATGTVTFGSGLTFGEIHYSASLNKRVVASGWATTVGIAGWSMGGGHGPYSPKFGIGSDQIVQAELVGPDASFITVNSLGTTVQYLNGTVKSTPNSDLLWALRGGGGSAWGVVTSYTVKSYPLPTGGYTGGQVSLTGDFCTGSTTFYTLLNAYLKWSLTLDNNWGGLAFFTPAKGQGDCPYTWTFFSQYLYYGPLSSPDFIQKWRTLSSVVPGITSYNASIPDQWAISKNKALEPIIPVAWLPPTASNNGGLPSVLVSRDAVQSGALGSLLTSQVSKCLSGGNCEAYQFYQDITGNINSPQDPNVSVNPGMRSALFHLVVIFPLASDTPLYYKLANYSYLSESAYVMTDWRSRMWGSNYDRLLKIKQNYDPTNVFWCRHCVGDTTP